jgi:hypothetical protein
MDQPLVAVIMSFVDGEWLLGDGRPFTLRSFAVCQRPAADNGLRMTPVMPLS